MSENPVKEVVEKYEIKEEPENELTVENFDFEAFVDAEDNFEPADEAKIFLLLRKIDTWKNTIWDAKMDYRVARELGDQTLLDSAKQAIIGSIKSIDYLQEELSLLKEGEILTDVISQEEEDAPNEVYE